MKSEQRGRQQGIPFAGKTPDATWRMSMGSPVRGCHRYPTAARPVQGGYNQGFSRVMTRPAGRVKGVSKSRGSGRVGSDQEFFKISRVRSGHDPRDTGHFAGQAIMTRELFWADPRVQSADLAGGSAFFKLTGESHVEAV